MFFFLRADGRKAKPVFGGAIRRRRHEAQFRSFCATAMLAGAVLLLTLAFNVSTGTI
jgi:hypothetical protein